MQYFKGQNNRTIMRIAGIVLLAGLLPIGLQIQPASAETQTPTYSLWSNLSPISADTNPIELGFKFRTDVDGQISVIRFYRAVPIDSGYTVHLWSVTGELLGSGVAIEGQGPTPGWQKISLYPPVSIKAGQTYIASYYTSKGLYTIIENFFNDPKASLDNGPLHALRDGEDGSNGIYTYALGGGFPTESWHSSNYWIDVEFKPTTP
ncbi:MAG TPA: DUF4082 domain-containing protein [Methylococcales bacterium]